MRWLHINHEGQMWPRTGLFIGTDAAAVHDGAKWVKTRPYRVVALDLVFAVTGFKRREFETAVGRTVVARPRYWIRFSWIRCGKLEVYRGVSPENY